ncbi:hypothetical protein [Streptomyces sp. NPDC088757]|uniref:hypothetical protein n=1 Tax=Streptomyces sp. NPDC088757 TaxID=3365889 RepID=UPI0038153B34
MAGGRSGAVERLRRLLGTMVDGEVENRREGCGSGCSTVNAITGLAAKDPLGAEILEKDLERRPFSFRSVIDVGKR